MLVTQWQKRQGESKRRFCQNIYDMSSLWQWLPHPHPHPHLFTQRTHTMAIARTQDMCSTCYLRNTHFPGYIFPAHLCCQGHPPSEEGEARMQNQKKKLIHLPCLQQAYVLRENSFLLSLPSGGLFSLEPKTLSCKIKIYG